MNKKVRDWAKNGFRIYQKKKEIARGIITIIIKRRLVGCRSCIQTRFHLIRQSCRELPHRSLSSFQVESRVETLDFHSLAFSGLHLLKKQRPECWEFGGCWLGGEFDGFSHHPTNGIPIPWFFSCLLSPLWFYWTSTWTICIVHN